MVHGWGLYFGLTQPIIFERYYKRLNKRSNYNINFDVEL